MQFIKYLYTKSKLLPKIKEFVYYFLNVCLFTIFTHVFVSLSVECFSLAVSKLYIHSLQVRITWGTSKSSKYVCLTKFGNALHTKIEKRVYYVVNSQNLYTAQSAKNFLHVANSSNLYKAFNFKCQLEFQGLSLYSTVHCSGHL